MRALWAMFHLGSLPLGVGDPRPSVTADSNVEAAPPKAPSVVAQPYRCYPSTLGFAHSPPIRVRVHEGRTLGARAGDLRRGGHRSGPIQNPPSFWNLGGDPKRPPPAASAERGDNDFKDHFAYLRETPSALRRAAPSPSPSIAATMESLGL